MNIKILLCILYFFNYSECFILNREINKDLTGNPTEMENINYGIGQSDVATKALTLSDVDEEVDENKATPHFTIKEKRCPRHGEVVGAVYQPVASQQINRRDLQSTINKRLCETCKASNTCSKLGNCDYCGRWCDKIDEQSTTESISVNNDQQNIVGQIHQIKPENIEYDPTKVSSRFGESTIGQTNPSSSSSSMPKYYVLGRLDAIMAIQIISKILGVQNPDDIKQLLILGSTKSDNPPAFGPSMHNISPEKANILTQALNNELEKIMHEKPDGALNNDDLNTAIENAVKNVESGTSVVGSPPSAASDDENVGCLEDLKEKIKDKLNDKKEEILPVYPIDPYQSNYRSDNGEIMNPKVIEDAPNMSDNVDLQSRLNDISTTVNPMENEEEKNDIVALPAVDQAVDKTPNEKVNNEPVEETPENSEKGNIINSRTFKRKFPSFERKTDNATEPTVGQSNGSNKNSILNSPTLQKIKKKFPNKFSSPYSRANKPMLIEKNSKPSAANILGRTRQFTIVPVTTEKILGSTEEESNTLNVDQNEKPKLQSASHFGVTGDDKVLGASNEDIPSGSNILKPMEEKFMENAKLGSELGGDIVKVVEDNIHTNEDDPIESQSPNEDETLKQGTKLGQEIVNVVKNNLDKPQSKGIFNMLEDQMKQSQKNLKNIFDVARANQAESVGNPQNSNNMAPKTEQSIGRSTEPTQNMNVMSRVPEIPNAQTESTQPIIVEPENLRNGEFEEVGAPQMPQIFEQPEGIDPSQMASEGQMFEEQPTVEENVENTPMDMQESNDIMPQQDNPDMMESRMQPEKEIKNGEMIVGNTMGEKITNHFGKIIPADGNSVQDNKSPNNVFFLGNGIKLPLQMHQNKDGSMDISVDMDRLCTCQNSTCPRNHNEIAETVGTILEKEAELKNQLESIDASMGNGITNTNNKQIRRDLGAMNNKYDHMEIFKRASNPFVPQSNTLQMSQFLSNDALSTTPKQYPSLNDIVQIRDMYKYKQLEQELANKLQTLNRNVEQFNDDNAKLFNKGAKTIFKTNNENVGVQKQVDILNNVLGWMKTVALTNTK